MEVCQTSAALVGAAALLVVAVLLDRRPYRPGRLNYVPLMILSLAACLVLGRHLLGLML